MSIFQPLEKALFIEYTNIKESIFSLNIGFMPNNIESNAAHFVPYIRATKYLSNHVEPTMPQDQYKELQKKVEKARKVDKKGKNSFGIINIDQFIMLIFASRGFRPRKKSIVHV